MVRTSEFDFTHPTGIIGIVLVVLSLVAFVVGLVLRVQGDEAASYGNWYAAADLYMAAIYTFVGALIGVIIGGIFLFISRSIKMKRTQPPPQAQPLIQPPREPTPHPPMQPPRQPQSPCPYCGQHLRFINQYQRGYCEHCKRYI